MKRNIEVFRIHKSNTCISIRDTGINTDIFDLVILEIGVLKNKERYTIVIDNNSLIKIDSFLDGELLDINSYLLNKTLLDEELLELEIDIFELKYYQLNSIGTFNIINNTITINQNLLYIISNDSVICINNKIYTINRNKSYNNKIVLNELIEEGAYNVFSGMYSTSYIINDSMLKDAYCKLLADSYLSIDTKCDYTVAKEDLVTLSLELKTLEILKETCDIRKIGSLIESIRNKLNITVNDNKCSC